MKVLVVTTPIRPKPTNFPPIGSLSILKYLRRALPEVETEFYHVDGLRPDYAQVIAHIRAAAPDVVGISSVVSTAYAYTKRLAQDIKTHLPNTLVVVGGNLAASAEILLRKAKVDLCVLSEGEKVFTNVVRRAMTTRNPCDFKDIPGLSLLDANGRLVNTLYEEPLDRTEVYDIDWADIEKAGCLNLYIYPIFVGEECADHGFKRDPRAYEPHRRDKTSVTMPGSKGCVARCTFCHRWSKGIRYIPVDMVMDRIRYLVDHHNLGFLVMGDENFGTDRRWLTEFCQRIKEMGILWRVGGMRVNCVSPEILDMMRDAGCSFIGFGMESGSERILEVMEKKTGIEHNRNAIEWTIECGINSPVQIVLGMPGECEDTIRETIDFCKFAMTRASWQNPTDISINYAQALPGTPLYEFARQRGLIGSTIDDEEGYLLAISDRDAHDEETTLNFTEVPTLISQTWRPRITIEVNYAFVRKFGLATYRRLVLKDTGMFGRRNEDTGYFANPKRLVDCGTDTPSLGDDADGMPKVPSLWTLVRRREFGLAMICHPVLFYHLRHLVPWMVVIKDVSRFGRQHMLTLLKEFFTFALGRRGEAGKRELPTYRSLRKIVDTATPMVNDDDAMLPLRKGR